jgi:hypothetical protein
MRVWHGVALALTGWYLMAPPSATTQADWERVSLRAPLYEWQTIQSFDTAKECEAVQAKMQGQFLTKYPPPGPFPLDVRPIMLGQCVATDDPRLKP